jgi:hypothetical protein
MFFKRNSEFNRVKSLRHGQGKVARIGYSGFVSILDEKSLPSIQDITRDHPPAVMLERFRCNMNRLTGSKRLSDHVGRKASECRAGLENGDAGADSPELTGRTTAEWEAIDVGTDPLLRGSGISRYGRSIYQPYWPVRGWE